MQILNFKNKNYLSLRPLEQLLEMKKNPEIAKQYQGGVHLIISFI